MIAKPSHERNSQKSEPGLVDQDAAISCILLSLSLSSPNTLLLISNTASKPSLPLVGFGVRMSLLRLNLSHETRSGSLQQLRQASQQLKKTVRIRKIWLRKVNSPPRVFPKAFHTSFFDLGPHLLPTPTQRCDPCFLVELGPLVAWLTLTVIRLVDHGFSHADHVRPGEIGAAHGHAFLHRVHIRCLV